MLNGCETSLTIQGAGAGHRVVPSASLPSPPVNPIYSGVYSFVPGSTALGMFIAAPVYLSDQGLSQLSFD